MIDFPKRVMNCRDDKTDDDELLCMGLFVTISKMGNYMVTIQHMVTFAVTVSLLLIKYDENLIILTGYTCYHIHNKLQYH